MGCWAPSTATVVSISTRSPSAVGQRSCETEETMRERGGRPMREQREASARAPRVGVRSAPGHRPPRRGGVSSGALTGLDGGGEQQGNGAEAEEHRGSSSPTQTSARQEHTVGDQFSLDLCYGSSGFER